MKNLLRMTFLMSVAMLVLTACGENSNLTGPKSMDQMETIPFKLVDSRGGDLESDPDYLAWLNRNVNAGMIHVANDVENLYVTYYLNDDWLINQADLHVANSEAEIPMNDQGLPKSDEFQYHIDLIRSVRVYTQQIPLADLGISIGQDIVVATRASLKPNNPDAEKENPGGNIDEPKALTNPEWWQITPYRVRLSTSGLANAARVKLNAIAGEVSYK